MTVENSWGIMDDNGIIYTGSEWAMRQLLYKNRESIYRDNQVKGDLLLIEIHATES